MAEINWTAEAEQWLRDIYDLYGHYRVVYLIKEDQMIDILGVFHGALDIDRYLP